MRRIFGKLITKIAEADSSVYLITGDIGYGVFDEFRVRFPDRFMNLGICEQSIIGAASGMALEGLKPWVYTITPFLIERPFEQIKLDIDQQNVNVKLVGYADYPTLGPTHAELDGKKLMSLMKNVTSFFPKDGPEAEFDIELACKLKGPAFISLKQDKNNTTSLSANK